MPFYIFYRHIVCLVDHMDLICSLYSWWEGFGSSQSQCSWVPIVVSFPALHVGGPLGFAHEAALEDLGLPLRGPGVEVVQLLGTQGFWQHQVLREVLATAAGNIVLQKDMTKVLANTFQHFCLENLSSLTEKAGKLQSTGLQRVGHNQSDPAHIDMRLFLPVAALLQ